MTQCNKEDTKEDTHTHTLTVQYIENVSAVPQNLNHIYKIELI